MNKTAVVGSVISGIVGAIIGGGGVYLYFKKIYDANSDKEYQIYQEELNNARCTITELQATIANNLIVMKDGVLKSKDKNEYTENLSSISSADEPDNITIEEIMDLNSGDDNIRFISPRDYEDDEDYEKETIRYYSMDKVLVDGDDELMDYEELHMLCGAKALENFGKFGADKNEIYIRNEEFNTDYKIKRYNISYERYINGLKS